MLYFFAMKFTQRGSEAKKEVVKYSFNPKSIDLSETTPEKAASKPLDEAEEDIGGAPLSPQAKGQKIHKRFAEEVENDRRDSTEGKLLKKMEDEFDFKFIKANVGISGYAVNRTRADFWSGIMDAVAVRRDSEDVLQVFVVDWKTTESSKVKIDSNWWKNATNFKKPLYQCLVYRELLQAHFKRNDVNAEVGIFLAPSHQSNPEKIYPGFCMDFRRMDEGQLLDGQKDFQWFPVLDKSIFNHPIKLPCKLFKESLDPAFYVDKSTNNLKNDTPLKDILNDNATVADLLQLLDLPFLKVEAIKKEEKTNEELEEVNKKCLHQLVTTAKFSVLHKSENNQHGVTLSLFSSFFLLWRAKPTRYRRKSLPG